MSTNRLMVKTHRKTGLRYLCVTKKSSWKTYKGSGKRWLSHLAVHGRDVDTELLFESDDLNVFRDMCLWYSDHYDAVESREWANILPENGVTGGGSFHHLDEEHQARIKERISKIHLGKPKTPEHKMAVSAGRIAMDKVDRETRADKIRAVYKTGKHDALFERYSLERVGASNPNAKEVVVFGVTYGSISEAMHATNMSRAMINNRLKSNKHSDCYMVRQEGRI